jgi:hypothetical protein
MNTTKMVERIRNKSILQFNEETILMYAGKVSHQVAIALAEGEYEK